MNDLIPPISLTLAFTAGLLSFASPCVAPLVPGYISYMAGVSLQEPSWKKQVGRTLWVSVLFVLGFSMVFVLLGASASLLGGFFEEHRRLLMRAAGVGMMAMGVVMLGMMRWPFLSRELRLNLGKAAAKGPTPWLLGMAFAIGWIPCVGPILASILFYAGAAGTIKQGMLLLFIYSLGLGVPFILSGLVLTRAVGALGWFKRHFGWLNLLSGAVLIGMGVLFFTERYFYVSLMAQKLYYSLRY